MHPIAITGSVGPGSLPTPRPSPVVVSPTRYPGVALARPCAGETAPGDEDRAGRSMASESLLMWRAYLRGHAAAIRAVETELLARHQLSLGAYEVLALLAEAPRGQLRMSQLADAALLSRAGTTRLVERLERIGVLIRVRVCDDGRGIAAALTDEGLRRLRRASTTHHEVVAQYFSERLDEADLATLWRISLRLGR